MLILWDKYRKNQKENNLNNLVQISDISFLNFKQQYKVLFIKNRWKFWKLDLKIIIKRPKTNFHIIYLFFENFIFPI